MVDVNMRPNIRIEIKNNVNESMDIDEEMINISEEEEGEINDKNDEQKENLQKNNDNKPRDIWAKFDNGTTIKTNTDSKKQLESVYASLNIEELWTTVRLDAVHMRGIGDMNTLDILKYFLAFSPTAIEWVDETSCNILWADMPMATKALYHLSKAIIGSKTDGSIEQTMDLDGQNNGLQNKHRVIEISDESDDKLTDEENDKTISVWDIKDDIPVGFWRLGNENVKAKTIFFRFALTTDKQPIRAEHFTEYYKQCGVIENGDNIGIISQSRKRKFLGIFDRNRDLSSTCDDSSTAKNPWGPLAESWHQDFIHTEPEYKTTNIKQRLESISNLQNRLGFKRAHLETENSENQLEIIEIRSDLEETEENNTNYELIDTQIKLKSAKKTKSKVPRMRMYADEEEAKIKRKKSLQTLKKKKPALEIVEEDAVESNDLRNVIGKRVILKPKRRMENMVLVVKQEAGEEEQDRGRHLEDLGNKLKHRHMTRLNEAAAKNSVHLRLHDVQTINTSYQNVSTYDAEPLKNQTPSSQHHHSPERHNHHHHHNHRRRHHHRTERTDRDARQRDTDRQSRFDGLTGGRMHSDREEYRSRRNTRRGERITSDRDGRRQRRDVEEEEIERVERKGAKSKVMIVVKRPSQPTVASMAILPRAPTNLTQARALYTTAHHKRHDNVRLATRESNQRSSDDSSSEDDSTSGSSTTSSDDDDDSSGDTDSDSSTSTDSSDTDTDNDTDKQKRGNIVRGAMVGVKGVNRENTQGSIRVQIKNEHYGK